jgi:hypothetical protein
MARTAAADSLPPQAALAPTAQPSPTAAADVPTPVAPGQPGVPVPATGTNPVWIFTPLPGGISFDMSGLLTPANTQDVDTA